MRLFYLIAAIVVAVLILIVSFAQVGATCVWYLIGPNSPAFLVLLQTAGLGAIMGGLLILFWKTPKPTDEIEEGDVEVGDE
ncbi:hypothetical protein KJ742_01750 [Patescibacteria group bacterium]|nr:hypothetical protein [Patescibacteria group bacterium]MBU1682648.1 hypothetical protein [Patescibacteria group bacterium]MBU1935650.1 hypothetical protein [Patescibacteria group bacterium]